MLNHTGIAVWLWRFQMGFNMLWLFVRPTGVYLLDFFCWGIQLYLLLRPYLCFISLLYFDFRFWEMIHWQVRGLSCKPNIYGSWSTSELRVKLAQWNRLKTSRKIFYWPFSGDTSFVDILWCFFLSCVCYAFVRVCLYVPCGHLLGKGSSWLSFAVSNCEFVTFPLISWVKCGTWLYRFLIIAPLLTLNNDEFLPFEPRLHLGEWLGILLPWYHRL